MQFVSGWIRQLTTRKEGTGKFEVRGTTTGRLPSERQKQLNIRIQSIAADIVTRLIAADVIHSQQSDTVEQIICDMLWRGRDLGVDGWEIVVVGEEKP
jgi:hypothetical protein